MTWPFPFPLYFWCALVNVILNLRFACAHRVTCTLGHLIEVFDIVWPPTRGGRVCFFWNWCLVGTFRHHCWWLACDCCETNHFFSVCLIERVQLARFGRVRNLLGAQRFIRNKVQFCRKMSAYPGGYHLFESLVQLLLWFCHFFRRNWTVLLLLIMNWNASCLSKTCHCFLFLFLSWPAKLHFARLCWVDDKKNMRSLTMLIQQLPL